MKASTGPYVPCQDLSFVDSILTDAALNELKSQSSNGCLLCALEALEPEDWE